jgi:predicted esterase YcpF (UPF0227 family)
MICFSNIPNKVKKNGNDALLFWEHPNYMENWQSIYDNPEIIPTQTKGILILNGNDILNKKVLNIKDLKFNMVLLMYLSKNWDNDYDYQRTLIDTNHYYETSPSKTKTKIIRIQNRENTSQ